MMQGPSSQFSSFGEDQFGEMYLAGLGNGNIYRVVEQCQAFQVTGTATNVSCPGAGDGTITLDIDNNTASYTIAWSTGAGNAELTSLPAGTYGVTATNNIGCARSLEFQIVEPDPPFIELTADGAALAASQGFVSYIWLLNGEPVDSTQEATFAATQSGDYSVLVTDANSQSVYPFATHRNGRYKSFHLPPPPYGYARSNAVPMGRIYWTWLAQRPRIVAIAIGYVLAGH
jgi:hypothetical protein